MNDLPTHVPAPHPRTIGWLGTTALAMGGSNQSLFLLGTLIASQGSAAIPLLVVGLLLGWLAAPGWTELVLMWPNRVGGIAATCGEAFAPYSAVLANLAGVCYWWGWVPTCGLTAILASSAITSWYLPGASVPLLAAGLVIVFTLVNLFGVRVVTRLAIPLATVSAALAFLSAIVPVVSGHVDWHRATTFHLITPFSGIFGGVTSAMAGLYLVGFAAPAFEAAACHVGETIDPVRNVPRAMLASGAMALVYFLILPVVWLGLFGPAPLVNNLDAVLGPSFAPLFGSAGRGAAVWFLVFNMFHGTLQPLAGASRTLMQLAEDGLLPRILALRSRTDTPWVATLLTAGMAIVFLVIGDPTWLIAAANLTYLIGICLPSVAVWLLRRDAPEMPRPYRAADGWIIAGLAAAGVWGLSTVLGFEQFGLPTVLAGLGLAFSGSILYAARIFDDRRRLGVRVSLNSLQVKLTGALLIVLAFDCLGYVLAVSQLQDIEPLLTTTLEDIFVVVALLTITVGLIIPGMIAHAAGAIARSAEQLTHGTLTDFTRAMEALGRGDLAEARVRVTVTPVIVHSRDELGSMAASFNTMQSRIAQAAHALEGASNGLQSARDALTSSHAALQVSEERFRALSEYGTDLVIIADVSGIVRYASQSLFSVLGIAPASVTGQSLYKSVHPEDVDHVRAALELTTWSPAEVRRTDLRIKSASEGWRTVEFIATNRLGDPAVQGIILSGRDVTNRVRDQRAADKARIAAEEIAYLRSDFVASVSHELRTPLTSIVGYGELLVHRWEQLDETARKDRVQRIVLAANRQKRLVEDLLLLSQLETSGLAPNMASSELLPLVQQAVDETQGSYHGQTIHMEGPCAQSVFADAARVVQIVANLLDNAAKYSPEHSPITISWQEDGHMVVIRVVDGGPGLGEDGRERLFTRFGRIRGSKMRAGRSGTGLGLFLGRRLAEAMDGTLDLESTGAEGSAFRLCLRARSLGAPNGHAEGGEDSIGTYIGASEPGAFVVDEPE